MNLAKGKEGYTSIAYNVICDHKGRAQAVLAGTYGAFNDKTIVRYDNYVHAIRTQAFFTELQYHPRLGPRVQRAHDVGRDRELGVLRERGGFRGR